MTRLHLALLFFLPLTLFGCSQKKTVQTEGDKFYEARQEILGYLGELKIILVDHCKTKSQECFCNETDKVQKIHRQAEKVFQKFPELRYHVEKTRTGALGKTLKFAQLGTLPRLIHSCKRRKAASKE